MVEPFDTIGDYILVEFLGRGGMGEVWGAVHRESKGPCAIKILRPDLSKKAASIESFRREAEIGMHLGRNDALVKVYGMHEALIGDPEYPERVFFLVLDLIDGVNLRRLLERFHRTMGERLPIPIVVHIIRSVLRALDAAHTYAIDTDPLPVVHGDVNPGNVLISSRGEVRVMDFGIARFAPEPMFISRPVGTMPYMAPEQYVGRICAQNDLYSVGALLHELLTGEPPLPAGGSPQTMERKLLQDPVPPLGRDDVPAALERLRRGLLEKKVELRIQTASKALEMLGTVSKIDCQDEIKVIYQRMFGPPRSRLTRYLQAQGDGAGSFVLDLMQKRRRPTSEEPPEELPAGDDSDDEAMPWLVEEDELRTTEVHARPGTKLIPTLLLDLPVGRALPFEAASTRTVPEPPPAANESPADMAARSPALGELPRIPPEPTAADSDPLRAAGPLLEPADDEDDLDAVTTAPRHAARKPVDAAEVPGRDLGRYPPRPPHLDDGVPFQRRRPNRGAQDVRAPADAGQPEPAASPSSAAAGSVTGPDAGPDQTKPQRPPDTRPDDLTKGPAPKISRLPNEPALRWLRMAFLAVAAVLLTAFGIGVVALASAGTQPMTASSDDPHPAPAATTGD